MIDAMMDESYMDEALNLAAQGRGRTSPNPMVGAVLVAPNGTVVGRGYHEHAGGPHAEIRALETAGRRAHSATLYCTLEPCSHVGRTGPCVKRIADAGVRRVVIGFVDPNPSVAGAGIAYLRNQGIEVEVGVRRLAALRQNEVFVTWMTQSRPFVIMKIAVSRDGMLAARSGVRTFLTSDAANHAVHQIRADVDAIGVGSETVLVDDPLLTARLVQRDRPLVRVIFDRRLRTSPEARIFTTLEQGPVLVATTVDALTREKERVNALREVGGCVEPVVECGISSGLQRLAERNITSILLEGGGRIHRAAWRAGVVDRVQRFTTAFDIGDRGVPWLKGESLNRLCDVQTYHYGPDILIDGYVHRVD